MVNLTKVCTKCNIEYELDNFYKAIYGAYKRSARCKKCHFEDVKEWQKTHKDKYNAQKRRQWSNRKLNKIVKDIQTPESIEVL